MANPIRTFLNAAHLVLRYPHYRKTQFYGAEQLRSIQENSFKKVATVALSQVPYYKALKLDIDLNNITLQDWKKFPIVNKELIRNDLSQFIREDVNQHKLEWKKTSGSSGKPFGVPKHFYSDAIEGIMGYRAWSMGKSEVYKFRSPALVLRSFSPKEGEPIYKYDALRRYWYLSPYHLNDNHLTEILDVIKRSKASLLKGYPSSLYILTLLLKKHGIQIPQIKTLVCSSESLLPVYRKAIEEYWGISVLDWYGQNERTVTVQQCWAGNFHNNDEYGMIELDDKNQIIATSLLNDIMPLIRYATGDIADPMPLNVNTCACGRNLSIPFRGIQGRSDDLIYKEDTTPIPSVNFYTAMESFTKVKQFKFIQQQDLSVTLMLVGNDLDANYCEQIKSEITQRLGNIPLTFSIVNEIPRSTQTEKIKTFESFYKPLGG